MQPLMENYMEIEKEDAPLEEPIQNYAHIWKNIMQKTLHCKR